jgi:NarL family two-component system response regulator YdfI
MVQFFLFGDRPLMRVYVLSAYPALRAGLAALVREQPGWLVTGEGAPDTIAPVDTLEDVDIGADTPPDVVLADLDGVTELDAITLWLVALRPRAGIVVIGPPQRARARGSADQDMPLLLEAIARATADQGLAFGVLLRDATTAEIITAIEAIASRLITLDRRLAGDLLVAPDRMPTPVSERLTNTDETLTARELEVLQLLAQGLPNKIIAARLHISEHTAKFHVSAIMMKLGAASRTEAVTIAARRGLLIL